MSLLFTLESYFINNSVNIFLFFCFRADGTNYMISMKSSEVNNFKSAINSYSLYRSTQSDYLDNIFISVTNAGDEHSDCIL